MRVVTLIEKYIYISLVGMAIQCMLIEMWFMCELNGMEWNELNGNILCTVLHPYDFVQRYDIEWE